MDDRILHELNETELISLARAQGLGRLRRGLPHDVLVKVVTGEEVVTFSMLCGTTKSRADLAAYIQQHIEKARSQLPGCTGVCTSYPCSEGRHALCYRGND